MNFLNNIYQKSLFENEKNIIFWEDYLRSLNALDFNVYSEKLSVPVLVPIGTRILFRGELKHTNEVTVALGADYFTKCSLKQAEVIRQHRIKDATSKLDMLKKEKEYLESQVLFSKQTAQEEAAHDIIEVFTEEEDNAWRKQHRENVKQYKQNKDKQEEHTNTEVTDEELWQRLEELELQEELENEMSSTETENRKYEIENDTLSHFTKEIQNSEMKDDNSNIKENLHQDKSKVPKQTPKLDLLQQVIERQNDLEAMLTELKNRERTQTKTEGDLLSRLDEMEKLEELEDEMDRLENILEDDFQQDGVLDSDDDEDEDDNEDGDNDDEKSVDEDSEHQVSKLKKSVSFADQDDSETLQLTFKHSDVEPNFEPYDSKKGITKPSDLYEANANLFNGGTTSILKKSKYGPDTENSTSTFIKEKSENAGLLENQISDVNRTIIIKDVIEKGDQNANVLNSNERPMSIFKKKRLHQKT